MARGGSNAARGNANHPLFAQLSTLYAPGLSFARFGTAGGYPMLNLARPDQNSGSFDALNLAPLEYRSTPFGPGLWFGGTSFMSSGGAGTAGRSPWTPNTDGAYRPVTIFAVFQLPPASSQHIYGMAAPDAGASGLPILQLWSNAADVGCRQILTLSGGNYVEDGIAGVGSAGQIVSVVYTSRTTTDHELVCFNLNTGLNYRLLPVKTIAYAATAGPSESFGARKSNLSFVEYYTGLILLAGFGYGGLTSSQAAALARDPFDLLDTQDLADEPSFYVSAATRARRSVIWL